MERQLEVSGVGIDLSSELVDDAAGTRESPTDDTLQLLEPHVIPPPLGRCRTHLGRRYHRGEGIIGWPIALGWGRAVEA